MTLRLLLPTLTFTLTLSSAALAAAEPVAFDSFTYTGRDDVFAPPLPVGHYRNPILAGYYPDPSICRVGDDYYLINSSFAHFPGIPIFHSRDLVNWEQIGHVIDRPTQLKYDGLGITRGIFAPAISHHNGVFYIVCTMVDAGGNFLMTAKDPAGPWSDPVWLDFDGIDPSLFFDDDGRAWMVNNGNPPDNQPLYQGHRAIWIQEFDITNQKLTGPRSIIVNGGVDLAQKPVWIEGPHLYKREGWYYLCCAEGGTSSQHSQVILRGKSPTGPFTPWDKNPILTQRDLDGSAPHAVTCTGHADLVIGPDGNWWSVFLACRPYAPDRWATGRETFLLPVKWTDDGWPQILPPGERVPYIVKSPIFKNQSAQTIAQEKTEGTEKNHSSNTRPSVSSVTSCENALVPLSGNFTLTDEFDQPALSPLWLMLRTPKETWWQLADGKLSLTPRVDALGGKGNPSFLGRRVQHAKFDASVTLAVPAESGIQAGLTIIQNEKQYFTCQVSRAGDLVSLAVVRCHQGKSETLVERSLAATDEIELQLHADATTYTFRCARDGGEPELLLAGIDSYPASVQAAGGGMHFTGALVGIYALKAP
ncbi:MAG: glycoside hydrolase family 43 protein [Lacunisphaera sp.]|nr:glycoside hydrolase family 43 protein [Lacunisphaera sp.]